MWIVSYTVLPVRVPYTLECFFLLPSDGCQYLVQFLGSGLFSGRPLSSCLLSVKEPWWLSWHLLLVPYPIAPALPAASQCFCLIIYLSVSYCLCAQFSIKTLIYPHSSGAELCLFLFSISPGNTWLRYVGSTAKMVSEQQSPDKAKSMSSGQRLGFSSVRTLQKCLGARDISFCLKIHLKSCPGPCPWTGIRQRVHSGVLK